MAAPPKTKSIGPAPSVRYASAKSQGRGSPSYAHGKASAQAVLDAASAVLKSHWDKISPKLKKDFAAETKRVLPKLGIKNIPDATISEIAEEAVDTSLDALSTIQSPEQIGQALADGLARTITANIDDPKLHQDKVYEQVLDKTEAIQTENAPELETAASLGNIILTLTTSPSTPVIAEHISQIVEEQVVEVAPLAAEEEITAVKKNVYNYTLAYQQTLADQLAPILESKKIPTLEQLQTIKKQTSNVAMASVPEPINLKSPIIPKTITANVATSIGFKPLNVETIEVSGLGITQPGTFTFADAAKTQGIGVGIGMSVIPQIQASSFNALLTNNSNFNQNLLALTKRLKDLEQIQKTRKLARLEKSERKTLEEKVKLFSGAKKDELKNPKKIATLRSFFQDLKTGNKLNWASVKTQAITNTYGAEYADISSVILKQSRPANSFIYQRFKPGINKLAFRFAPQAFLANPNLLAGKARGSLGFSLRNLLGRRGTLSSVKTQAITNTYGAEYADISSVILKQSRPANSFIYQRFKPQINKLALKFAPQAFLSNPALLAGKARGKLGFSLGGLPAGSLSSIFKNAFSKSAIKGGMGMNPAVSFARKLAGVLGSVFGGLGVYFLMLGQAAFTGFMIGAGIGMTGGAVLGAALPVMALGPAGILLWPVTIPLGAFAFGIVGGLVGGLIALGLASGSITMVSSGVGAGIGGVIGGYVGFLLGGAISGAFITFAAAACAATLVGCVLVPIAAVSAPVITLTFTALGALAGAIVGGFAGYVVGKFLLDPISNFFGSMGKGISGISFGTPSFLGTIGGGFTSAASLGWNAVTGSLSSFFSTTTGIIGGIPGFIGSLGSAAVGTTTTMIGLVGGTTGGIVGLTTLTVIGVGAAFFTLEAPIQNYVDGNNQYFSIAKTANVSHLDNPPPNQDLIFTITLTAKANLTNIEVTDMMTVTPKDSVSFTVTQDKVGNTFSTLNCPPTLNQGETCNVQITITVNDQFVDSSINNRVSARATPEGQEPTQDSTTVVVTVGNPPTNCFDFQGSWADADRDFENNAIAELAKSSTFISMVCSAGTVILNRINSDDYNFVECPNIINISNKGVGTQSNTTFVLAHEAGHIIQCQGLQVYQDFLNAAPYDQDGYICSYPLGKTAFEDFAETIGVYVVWKYRSFNCSDGSIDFPGEYPVHNDFARNNLFGGFEY